MPAMLKGNSLVALLIGVALGVYVVPRVLPQIVR